MAGKMVENEVRQGEGTYRSGVCWGVSACCDLSGCEEQG